MMLGLYSFKKLLQSIGATILLIVSLIGSASARGTYLEVSYAASKEPGGLQLPVTYTLWIPAGVARLRGIIVHQHGCGFDANRAGETAAYDLHWQALAAKWDCALLGPAYKQSAVGMEGCRPWCDPRNGSNQAFLRAIDEFATRSGHDELKSAPWCLWGHSGGAFWASLMQTLHPERIVAVWLRSGTAYPSWVSGEILAPSISEAVYRIPTMLNPGIKESTDGRPIAAWLGSSAMFKDSREHHGAAIAFAADPLSGHDCGDSRYLAIPYFDACLALRLPDPAVADQSLRAVDLKRGWLAELMGRKAMPAAEFKGIVKRAVWLPDERVARAWMEYVQTGAVGDTTPPEAPKNVTVTRRDDGATVVTWDAVADFESGLRAFIIERDGRPLAQVPETPVGKFGRPLFQTMSFHDTPEAPLPAMQFVDATAMDRAHAYAVIAVNAVELKSAPGVPGGDDTASGR
jgi:hypothetical protein